jgi:hypothetical protein
MTFALLLSLTVFAHVSVGQALAQPTPVVQVNQGPNWTPALRSDFYSRDQGSKMIPLNWLRALKQANGQPFMADSLGRYGYLPNPANSNGLPVGFTASGPTGAQTVGMTCSACHTRQINVAGKAYRIDGGPAIVDFQSLLSDLDVAVGNIVTSDETFAPFAAAVLGSAAPDPADVSALRRDVDAWYLRYHTLITRALPKPPARPWGPARVDAVGMIFNRLTGLDLGPPPSLLIFDNIKIADVPVRYPFLWNAPKQDQTQWPGFADNGNDILALGRNLGEVFGVFAVFEPKKEGFVINFLNNNSANFDGLGKVEDLIKQIGPPKWPWPVSTSLAAQGKAIFERSAAQGGCAECHGIRPGKVRFFLQQTWATPIQNVGTDTRQYDLLIRTAKTGVLQGAYIPLATQPLKETDFAISILATAVLGSIAEHVLSTGGTTLSATERAAPNAANAPNGEAFRPAQLSGPLPPALRDLQGAFRLPGTAMPTALAEAAAPQKGAYEARVMQGIWAAAPYLHNGSVPTLAELLKPASERVKKFKIGPAYDTTNIGLAEQQTQFNYELETTDCSDRNSGNSRCGHEFGTTQLNAAEKRALLEYLKTL